MPSSFFLKLTWIALKVTLPASFTTFTALNWKFVSGASLSLLLLPIHRVMDLNKTCSATKINASLNHAAC